MKYICFECGLPVSVDETKYRREVILFCSVCKQNRRFLAYAWPEEWVEREICYNGDTYIKQQQLGKCFECQEMTQWISISFEGYVCSPLCGNVAWDKFFGEN